jgi:hypothetical protein
VSSGPLGDPHPGFGQVVVVGGHLVDLPDRSEERFPARVESNVTHAVSRAFDSWGVGAGSLVISGGARGADVIAAEQGRMRAAEVWLLVALPDDDFVERSVRLEGSDWESRYRALRAVCATWFQADALGPPPSPEAAFARNNRWMLDVGAELAPVGALKVLVVWDGLAGDGPGGTADLVDAAVRAGAQVEVIHPSTS